MSAARTELPEHLQSFKEKAEGLLIKFEERRGTKAIPLLYSMNRLIAKPDVDDLYDVLYSIGKQPKIDVILFSRGGDPDQAYIMGSMLQEFAEEKLTVIVPRFAKSAATLIACSGDELVMGPASELGPIDLTTEIEGKYISVMSIIELVNMIKQGMLGDMSSKAFEKIPVLELGDYNRLSEHTPALVEKILARRMFKNNPDKAKAVADELCKSYKSHTAAIISEDLRGKLNLVKMEPDSWDLIWKLHRLWVDAVISYEAEFPEGASLEPVNFRLGNGLVFCVKLVEEKR